jgi:hypothetical protein
LQQIFFFKKTCFFFIPVQQQIITIYLFDLLIDYNPKRPLQNEFVKNTTKNINNNVFETLGLLISTTAARYFHHFMYINVLNY